MLTTIAIVTVVSILTAGACFRFPGTFYVAVGLILGLFDQK